MGNLFAELKRRHIYRVAAAYAVVAWILLQLATNLVPALNLPNWVSTLVVVLLTLGFPLALLFAWIQDIGSPDGSAPATSRLDMALFGALIVVIGIFAYQQVAPGRLSPSERANVVAAREAAPGPAVISVAVLPFDNLSGDTNQQFFSDGMTEEITAALAKVPDLRVVARSSAFQFRNQNRDMQSIGQQLHATHFIEGSVRKAGNRVRITAQLIKADDGTHLWADNYDRELTDVFAIQEDIARAIAVSLRAPLGLQQGQTLVSNRNIDQESYEQYLRGRALVRARGTGVTPAKEASDLLEQVVARNPGYAPAWAQLCLGTITAKDRDPAFINASLEERRRMVSAFLPKADAAGQRAIQLDPNLADGYVALGRVQIAFGKWALAEELLSKAVSLDPANPDALSGLGNAIAAVGRVKEALLLKQRALALEPFIPIYIFNASTLEWLNGENDTAIRLANTLPAEMRSGQLAMILAATGRYNEAADALLARPLDSGTHEAAAEGARLLRRAPSSAGSPQSLPRLPGVEFVYLYVGAPERVLDFDDSVADAGFLTANRIAVFWHPSLSPMRKTERFKAFARKAGLVEYWRAKGWPPQCHPTTGDDFECE